MSTAPTMLTTYTTDGVQRRFTFNWPYLDRTNVFVTRDGAPALFKFVGDYELDVYTLFGEPLPAGEVLKIMRVTPDLVSFAEFHDSAHLTAADLNRARLQVLFLIQERSGGITGSVGQVIQLVTSEIQTLSGAMDSLQYSQGLLTAGLQTLDELDTKIEAVGNEAEALAQQIQQTVTDYQDTALALNQRMDAVESSQDNLRASVSEQVITLITQDAAQASRVDELTARVDAVVADNTGPDGPSEEDLEQLSASLITAAIAEVKANVATAKRVDTLSAQVGDNTALIQTVQEAMASADEALAQQITTLQAEIEGNLAQIQEDMQVTADAVGNLNAQYTLKVAVQRPDGKPIMAGIGVGATANDDMSGSEIVMMADRLVFADPNAPNGTLRSLFIAGNVDGSPTFIIPANIMGDRTYPGRLLVDGSIDTRHLAALSVKSDQIDAGAVTAQKINVNSLSAIAARLGYISSGAIDITSDGAGGWGYVRSAAKWLDNQWGWVLARHADGSMFVDMQGAGCGMTMTSFAGGSNSFSLWGPGFRLDHTGLTVTAVNIIGYGQIINGSVTNALSARSSTGTCSLAFVVPDGQFWECIHTATWAAGTLWETNPREIGYSLTGADYLSIPQTMRAVDSGDATSFQYTSAPMTISSVTQHPPGAHVVIASGGYQAGVVLSTLIRKR